MEKEYILAMIGAGSTYTPELMDGIIARKDSLHFKEIRLMDIDERKLNIVGGLSKRMISAAGLDSEVILTMDLDEALKDADFVVTQIRVGRLPARILDETIPLKYDLIGQETTGIGGFFKALRTIPVMLHIAKRMEELCPNAFLVNFTNPSGIITQAIHDNSSIRVVGLCNIPINMVDNLAENLGLDHVNVEYVGLNHLSWVTKIEHGGKDYLPEALEAGMNAEPMKNIDAAGFSKECLCTVGGIPSGYLEYYYNREKMLAEEKAAPKCRGQVCQELEEELLAMYQDQELCVKPKQLEQRGGAKYSLAAISLIDAIANDKQEVHIVGVENGNTLPFMRPDDIIEVACKVGKDGVEPLPIPGFHNDHIEELMRTVKAYERHAVRAAVTGDEDEAIRALLIHPLVGDFHKAKECFREMKEAHAAYLPNFA